MGDVEHGKVHVIGFLILLIFTFTVFAHVIVAYIMKSKAGYDYLATAAHLAAESSTGTNVIACTIEDFTKFVGALVYYIDPENEETKILYPNMLFYRNIDGTGVIACTIEDFTKYVGALVYYIDPENEETKILYPNMLFYRNIDGTGVIACTIEDFTKYVGALVYYIDPENEETKIFYPNMLYRSIDGRAMVSSVLTLTVGNNQGMGDVEYGKIYDIYFLPEYLRLSDGPFCSIIDMRCIMGRGTSDGGLEVGDYRFWQGCDFIENDEPQGNQIFCHVNECIPEVVMQEC